MSIKRFCISLPVCSLIFAASSGAGTIQYELSTPSPSDPSVQQYTYLVSGFTLSAYQELEIVFPVASFGTLSNAAPVVDFSVSVIQPNNPLGTDGDYDAEALINNPPLTGPFSVDFTYIGVGTPGAQEYFIYQFSSTGTLEGLVDSGSTVAYQAPEPGTLALAGLLVVAGGVWRAVRRHPARTA
ncbi:MAG: PEP-CTERM sorting domain-containing protein [Bryobacteraceae bacterium]